MKTLWTILIKLWESAQVELHGTYSTTRTQELAMYESSTTWFHEILILLGTPVPCLVVTVLIDLLPLGDPSDGVAANNMFFVRQYYSWVVLTFFAMHQFRIGVRAPQLSLTRAIGYSNLISAITVSIVFCLISTVGFPLPFTFLFVSPVWLLLTSSAMAIEWKGRMREDIAAAKMMTDINKLWLCDTLMVFIYPAYFYIFTTFSSDDQTVFSLLLPVIKLCMRNLFARMADHLKDETPEIVVFNAELFNSLFVSYCMQTSPSFTTTLLIMIANVMMMAFSLRDMLHVRRGLYLLENHIDKERRWSSLHDHICYNVADGRPLTTIERTSALLQQETTQTSTLAGTLADKIRISSYYDTTLQQTQTTTVERTSLKVMPKRVFSQFSRSLRDVGQNQIRAIVHPTVGEANPVENTVVNVPHTLNYVCKVQRLLYMTEFIILLKYVEVSIPLVYTIYLIITFRLPNRAYYDVFDGMGEAQMIQTLSHVLFYCSLQLVSLIALIVILKRMLGIPPTRQLAFVLEKQFHWVQTSLIFWVFYNVQASLQHCGYDYSLQFAWLTGSNQN